MRVTTLRAALAEYRMSLLIRVKVMGEHRFDLTVANMLANLSASSLPDGDHVSLFGSTDFIIKERNADFAPRAVAEPELPFPADAPLRDYLEIDVRL